MKTYHHKEIMDKLTALIGQKWLPVLLIAISGGISGVLFKGIHLSRISHTLLTGLSTAIIVALLYILLFGVVYTILYLPKSISWKGSIHRLEYFLVILGSFILYLFNNFIYAPERYGLDYKPTNLMLLIGYLIAFFLIYIQVCACIKRLNDLKWSKWLAIIHIIPFVSLGIRIPCLFIKSKVDNSNDSYDNVSSDSQLDNINTNIENSVKANIQIKEPWRTILIVILSVLATIMICFSIGYKIINTSDNSTKANKLYETKFNLNKANWIPISETWSFDINSIKQSGDYASISTKVLANKRNESGRFVKYICYVDVFKKDTFEHQTVLMIDLDDNMKEIDIIKFPYGKTVMEYPQGSMLEIFKDIAFLTKEEMKNAKAIVDMGILDYFTPYVNTGSDKSKEEAEAQLRAILGK